MTLGKDPVPLTRRQARELANSQASEATPEDTPSPAAPSPVTPPPEAPDTQAPTPRSAVPAVPADAPATKPAPSKASAAKIGQAKPPRSTSPRSLTRRELREMKAAAAAAVGEIDVEHPDEEASPTTPGGGTLSPPVGHWSVDRDEEHSQTGEVDQSLDQLKSGGIGAGGIPTTANALILPSIPVQGNASGPLPSSTGEVLITGSFDLPRSLGATGQHPNTFDSSEMDHMLDPLDESGPSNSVAPVSASRAVSTHTSTRGVMTPPKKSGTRLPMILAVTAALLAVGVIALFIAGYAFDIF